MDGALVVDEPTFQVRSYNDHGLSVSQQPIAVVDHVRDELDFARRVARTDLIEKFNRLKDETIALL